MDKEDISLRMLLWSILFFVLVGAYMGYIAADITQAVAKPRLSLDDFLVSQTMVQLYGPLLEKEFMMVEWLTHHSAVFILIHLLVFTLCYTLLLTSAFENMKIFWQRRKSLVLVIAFSLLCFHLLLLFFSFIWVDSMTDKRLYEPFSSLPKAVLFLLMYALFTLFAYGSELIRNDGDMSCVHSTKPLITALIASVLFMSFVFMLSMFIEKFGSSLLIILGPAEGSEAGWQTLHYVMMAVFSFIVAFSGMLILFLLKPKPLSNSAFAVVIVVITFVLGKLYVYYLDDKLDMRFSSLNEAAKLTVSKSPPPTKRLLLFNTNLAYDANSTAVITWEKRVEHLTGTNHGLKEPVDLIEENIRPLATYIQNSGHTYYTDAATQALIEIKKLNLDIDGYRESVVTSMQQGGTFLNAIMLTVGLSNMPTTEENRRFLELLSDEHVFHISDTNALILAKLWMSFGDEQKAAYFYEKNYFHDNPHVASDDKYIAGWKELQQTHRFNAGRISGTLHGLPEETQVALVSCERAKERPSLNFHEIKAVTRTSHGGDFLFENLVAGEYTLAVVLPETAQELSKPEPVLHISISEENPQHSDIMIR